MTLPEIDLPHELARLKQMGWIESRRKSDTGIGKTLEDMLGIPENNLGEPDCTYQGKEIEVKAHRISSKAMITLFTSEPNIRKLYDVQLMEKYGYINGKGRQALKITLSTNQFTSQGLKLETSPEAATISIVDTTGERVWIWTKDDLHLKLHNLCVVYADTKKQGEQELFRLKSAVLAEELDDRCFSGLLTTGKVTIDLRMHIKENGASRNHGTAFRIKKWEDLVGCYSHNSIIL